MRATILSASLFLIGVLAMSRTATRATADELKEGDRVWNEKVTVKVWDARGKKFLNPVADVWALRKDTTKGLMFDVRGTTGNTIPVTGSVIIDAAGNEFFCTEVEAPPFACFVKPVKMAAPKKP